MKVWLIGAGPHAIAYAKVLIALNIKFQVIGRGHKSATLFKQSTGVDVHADGLLNALSNLPIPDTAIVAVSFEQLASVVVELMKAGVAKVLLEKPGGLSLNEISYIQSVATQYNSRVWIAYNRRFYASTEYMLKLIEEDGGAISSVFEFTEWASSINSWLVPEKVKEALLIANSSHVIDLAFYVCGLPMEWKFWHSGKLSWHSNAARYCGAGVTDRGVLFSYHADWEAPGRWGLEVLTRKRRIILRPMEKLNVMWLGSNNIEETAIDDSFDIKFKPGLYKQVEAFINDKHDKFCTLEMQVKMIGLYSEMAGYK
jgi:predicted dehydrogenase